MAKYLRQATAAANGKMPPAAPTDPQFSGLYPALFEYLTVQQWEKGKPRETATMTVFCDGDTWKLSFNDRDNHRSAFVSAETFTEALKSLEEGLQSDELDWRRYDAAKSRFRK